MRVPSLGLSLRTKLALVSIALLALPWAAWRYVKEMERFLLEAQQTSLLGTARAVATALHERPHLLGVRPDDSALRRQAEEELKRLAAQRAQQAAQPPKPVVLDDGTVITQPILPPPPVTLTPPPEPVVPTQSDAVEDSFDEVRAILKGLDRSTSRIWVVDRRYRVIALAGSLKHPLPDDKQPAKSRLRGWMEHPLRWLMPPPDDDFDDELDTDFVATAKEISGAFLGAEHTAVRVSPDGKATIVSAAHPIWSGDQVVGAVVAEETTNAILAARNAAMERLLLVTLTVFAIVALTLLGFATRLSSRIRRLRDAAEAAIDSQGRITAQLSASSAGDEVGDLSRSFSRVITRLSQHHGYLEGMASRLSHELRTPIAVVRSSLENMRLQSLPDDANVYLDRANEGLVRLTTVLTRMTEATRLEQSLSTADRERYDLAAVVAGCVDGYRQAFSPQVFDLSIDARPIPVDGAPDLLAQMLDKLVSNAVSFARAGTPVRVVIAHEYTRVRLSVINEGPPLPEEMRERLFQSMVSVRKDRASGEPHLGLGLYVARLIAEFHNGSIEAHTLPDGSGVSFDVRLPLGV